MERLNSVAVVLPVDFIHERNNTAIETLPAGLFRLVARAVQNLGRPWQLRIGGELYPKRRHELKDETHRGTSNEAVSSCDVQCRAGRDAASLLTNHVRELRSEHADVSAELANYCLAAKLMEEMNLVASHS